MVADSPNLPERWSADENVAWRTSIPGLGWSSPIVAGGLVFVTTVASDGEVESPESGWYRGGERPTPEDVHHWLVYALDLDTGETRWRTEIHAGVPESSHHLKNTFASETPVTDGEHLYVLFGNVGLYALGFDGTVRWSRDLPPAETRNGWGTASSPVLHDGRVYLVVDNEEQSYLAALSAETGAELWRTDRDEGSNWSTPFVWEHDGRTEIVTTGTDRVRNLRPRRAGAVGSVGHVVHRHPEPRLPPTGCSTSSRGTSPTSSVPSTRYGPARAGTSRWPRARPPTSTWRGRSSRAAPTTPRPLVYGDYYYTLLDRGMMTAHDARTGAEVYGRRRIDVGHAFTASPWAYNGKIFALSEQGTTYVIEAGPEFRVLAENPLDEFTMATPAILDDSLIIRTAEAVYRIAEP